MATPSLQEIANRVTALDGIGAQIPSSSSVPTIFNDLNGLRTTINQLTLTLQAQLNEVANLVNTLQATVNQLLGLEQPQSIPSGFGYSIKTITSAYHPVQKDGTILCSGTFTITLDTTVFQVGTTFRIKNINTGVITIASSVNIDFSLSTTLSNPGDHTDVQWDGTQWWIL